MVKSKNSVSTPGRDRGLTLPHPGRQPKERRALRFKDDNSHATRVMPFPAALMHPTDENDNRLPTECWFG